MARRPAPGRCAAIAGGSQIIPEQEYQRGDQRCSGRRSGRGVGDRLGWMLSRTSAEHQAAVGWQAEQGQLLDQTWEACTARSKRRQHGIWCGLKLLRVKQCSITGCHLRAEQHGSSRSPCEARWTHGFGAREQPYETRRAVVRVFELHCSERCMSLRQRPDVCRPFHHPRTMSPLMMGVV